MRVRGSNIETLVDIATIKIETPGRERQRTNLEIAELGKLLATVIESAEIRLGLIVNDLVGPYVSALSKTFPADLALVRSFSSVSSLVSL